MMKINSSLNSHQMPLFGVVGIIEGQRSLRAAEHSLLGVPEDMGVSCQDVRRLDSLSPHISQGSSPRLD